MQSASVVPALTGTRSRKYTDGQAEARSAATPLRRRRRLFDGRSCTCRLRPASRTGCGRHRSADGSGRDQPARARVLVPERCAPSSGSGPTTPRGIVPKARSGAADVGRCAVWPPLQPRAVARGHRSVTTAIRAGRAFGHCRWAAITRSLTPSSRRWGARPGRSGAHRCALRHDGRLRRLKFHHGDPFRLAVLDGVLDPERTIQIGIRGSSNMYWEFSHVSGMTVIEMEETCRSWGWPA